jgi:hypothetical protein
MKRITIALLLAVLTLGGIGAAWEHHDVKAVACTDRPGPC